jgi:hypothetical protein
LTKRSVLRQAASDPSALQNVILYLPQGPVFQHTEAESPARAFHEKDSDVTEEEASRIPLSTGPSQQELSTPQQMLADATSATVVTLNYRLGYLRLSTEGGVHSGSSSLHRFPTPIHDTLAGLDWVLQNLRPEKLCIFGAHVGGSLATMLALTESRSVQAIAAYEPICDWTGLDEYCSVDPEDVEQDFTENHAKERDITDQLEVFQTAAAQLKVKKRKKKGLAPVDLAPLLAAREQFFETPSNYFDAFASPLLLLRSPGKDVPQIFPRYLTGPEYPTPVPRQPEQETLVDMGDMYTHPEDATTGDVIGTEMPPSRRRKALSRWPPYGLDYGVNGPSWADYGIRRLQVTLPWVRLYARSDHSTSRDSIVLDEAEVEHFGDSKEEPIESPKRQRRTKSSKSSVRTDETVLERQADEMVSVMRRACFWGREKGYGERRVELHRLSSSPRAEDATAGQADDCIPVEVQAGQWFRDIMDGKSHPL